MGEPDFEAARRARRARYSFLGSRARRLPGSLAVLGLAFLTLGCREREPAGGVEIATLVSQPQHDFGRVSQGDTLRHAFVTQNSSKAPVRVEDTPRVLGCAGVPTPRVLEPGRAGTLEVTCHASVYGPLRVALPIRANGRLVGELSLAAEVEPLLVFDRALLEFDVPFGAAQDAKAELRGKLARAARLTLAGELPRGMVASVQAGGAGQALAVQARGVVVGTHVGNLRFFTGLAEPKEIALPYVVKVTGTLTVSPTNPVLDLGAPGGTRAIVTVTSSQPGFRVLRAHVLEGPFVARVRRRDASFEVEVSVVPSALVPGARAANGRLQISSNDRTESVKELPLFALGRPLQEKP
ncbi:MAG TPA: DUF1573 domain-containing protein [Polyangiaceae bacterium]